MWQQCVCYYFLLNSECIIKQLLDLAFVISEMIKACRLALSALPLALADNTYMYYTLTMIIIIQCFYKIVIILQKHWLSFIIYLS